MPQPCSICIHPKREEIDRDLLAGVPLRNIAERCSVSTTALHRHKTGGHIAQVLTQAKAVGEVAQADTLLEQIQVLLGKARTLTDLAEEAGDLRTALLGIKEVRGVLELMAKVTGEMRQAPLIGIIMSPEWAIVRNTIVTALDRHPQARDEVIEALERLPVPAYSTYRTRPLGRHPHLTQSAGDRCIPVVLADKLRDEP